MTAMRRRVYESVCKKGSTYGTILVNLERHEVVDLLPERSQESLVAWFRSHPAAAEVEVAARDRSNIYREGLAKGVPDATHVADRWHLLHNLTLTLEEYLLQKRPVLRRAAAPEAAPEEKDEDDFASGPIMPNRPRTHDRKIEEAARKRHERLVEQWKNIRRLYLAKADLRTAATATEPLWGSTPIRTFMGAHLRFDRTSACGVCEGHSYYFGSSAPIPLLSHSACRVLYGGTQAENKPTRLVGDRKFASDPFITGTLEA
jgi:hypothetical protein